MSISTVDEYGPTIASLLSKAPLNELGPGTQNVPARTQLKALSPQAMFAPHAVVDRTMAKACLAGLWLRFDFLDESHSISQEIKNATGSFWHGILHRREPDYDNAKYWFHRVGEHPVFAPLSPRPNTRPHRSAKRITWPRLAAARMRVWRDSPTGGSFSETAGESSPRRICDRRNSPS